MESDWKYKRTPLTEEEAAYLYDIWGCAVRKNTEDVLIRQGTSDRKTMAPLRSLVVLDGKDVPSAKGLAALSRAFDRFPGCDLYFSPNTFRVPKKGVKPNARETSLFAVYAWALDIDYKKAYESRYDAALSSWTQQKEAELEAMKPQTPLFYYDGVLRPLMEELGIPAPNWIEYGHQLRLIYVLAEPVCAARKSGRKMLAAIKCIMQRFSDILNDHDPFIGAEPQKIASCFRVPGSVNKKDGARVRVARVSGRKWTVQEILGEWMPDCPDWYEEWKARGRAKKPASVSRILPAMLRGRLEAFKRMRLIEGIYRERLTFLYGNTLAQLEPGRDIMEELLLFNQGFRIPLPEREVRSKLRCCGQKIYKYTVRKIAETLNLSEKVLAAYGIREAVRLAEGVPMRSASDAVARIRAERAVKLAEAIEVCEYLREQGLNQKAVAERMRVSVRTVQRYERAAKDKAEIMRIRKMILERTGLTARERAERARVKAGGMSRRESALEEPAMRGTVLRDVETAVPAEGMKEEPAGRDTETLTRKRDRGKPPAGRKTPGAAGRRAFQGGAEEGTPTEGWQTDLPDAAAPPPYIRKVGERPGGTCPACPLRAGLRPARRGNFHTFMAHVVSAKDLRNTSPEGGEQSQKYGTRP